MLICEKNHAVLLTDLKNWYMTKMGETVTHMTSFEYFIIIFNTYAANHEKLMDF